MGKTDIIRQLTEYFQRESIHNMVLLTDENVERLYPEYFSELSERVSTDKIVLPAGEPSKSMETAIFIWNHFSEKQYDRNLFLLNFGGGMVCDLGGFVASTYKRGIRFANCPTTLLAMIDAAVGGKNGVNLQFLKNGVGTFYYPDLLLPVDVSLLKTLPNEELHSGFGELVKYALIGSEGLFKKLYNSDDLFPINAEYIDFCVNFKRDIVEKDPHDYNIRHILNFGHTFGHAIESYCAEIGQPVAHGIAVAQGLYYESFLSMQLGHLPQEEWQQIADFLTKHFNILPITFEILEKLTNYMLNDKKNQSGLVNFTLLNHIGHASPNFQIPSPTLSNILHADVCNSSLQTKSPNHQSQFTNHVKIQR